MKEIYKIFCITVVFFIIVIIAGCVLNEDDDVLNNRIPDQYHGNWGNINNVPSTYDKNNLNISSNEIIWSLHYNSPNYYDISSVERLGNNSGHKLTLVIRGTSSTLSVSNINVQISGGNLIVTGGSPADAINGTYERQ